MGFFKLTFLAVTQDAPHSHTEGGNALSLFNSLGFSKEVNFRRKGEQKKVREAVGFTQNREKISRGGRKRKSSVVWMSLFEFVRNVGFYLQFVSSECFLMQKSRNFRKIEGKNLNKYNPERSLFGVTPSINLIFFLFFS